MAIYVGFRTLNFSSAALRSSSGALSSKNFEHSFKTLFSSVIE